MGPRVSVVITTYNQRAYIGETIRSAQSQTFLDREIIVVDDGSTDETEAVVASFGDQVRYIRQTNQGVAGSRNTGIDQARGEFVAFLDGDDVWEPTKLEIQVAAADQEPLSGLSAVDGVQFSDDSTIRSSLFAETIRQHLPAGSTRITLPCFKELIKENLIPTTSQVMIPKRVLEDIGTSDTRFKLCSDWDLYLRIATRYPFTFINRPLIHWRYLNTSASGPAELRRFRWTEDDLKILKKQLRIGRCTDAPMVREELLRKISQVARGAYFYGRRNSKSWALIYLLRLLGSNPTSGAIMVRLVALALPHPLVREFNRLARHVLRGGTST